MDRTMHRIIQAALAPAILLAILLCGGCKTGEDLVLPQQHGTTSNGN